MRIISFGDIHMKPEQAKMIPKIKEADCVVVSGDLTFNGGRAEAQEVLTPLTALHHKLYAQIGNMDKEEVDVMLTEQGINLHGRSVLLGEVGLFGLGGSNPSPFSTPSEFSEEDLAKKLWEAYEGVKTARFKVLFSHPPPINTKLDKITTGMHVGSQAVRDFIEQTDCHACICGHIHEAVGTDKLGTTFLVNPGELRKGGYVSIECDGDNLVVTLEYC